MFFGFSNNKKGKGKGKSRSPFDDPFFTGHMGNDDDFFGHGGNFTSISSSMSSGGMGMGHG